MTTPDVASLLRAFRDPGPSVRQAATERLRELVKRVPTLAAVAVAAAEADPLNEDGVYQMLEALEPAASSSNETVAFFCGSLTHSNEQIRIRAANGLHVAASRSDVQTALISALAGGELEAVIIAFIGTLARVSMLPEVRLALDPLAEHEDRRVREAAVNGLWSSDTLQEIERASGQTVLHLIPTESERHNAADLLRELRLKLRALDDLPGLTDEGHAGIEAALALVDDLEATVTREFADAEALTGGRERGRRQRVSLGGMVRGLALGSAIFGGLMGGMAVSDDAVANAGAAIERAADAFEALNTQLSSHLPD